MAKAMKHYMEKDITKLKEFLKNMAFLELTNDLTFKAYFSKNKTLLKSILKSFLPLPKDSSITDITLLNTEQVPGQISKPAGKTFVLDLKLKIIRKNSDSSKTTELVNVEAQTISHGHFLNRILAYTSRLYADQLQEGDEYKHLMPVYSLVFTTKNLKEFEDVQDDYRHVCNI